MLIGYARVSTQDQNPALQIDALRAAGCEKIFEETASGAQRDRIELKKALEFARAGDSLVVWKLDRLARSLKQLIMTVEELDGQGVSFCSLTEEINTKSAGGKLVFHVFGSLAEFERSLTVERTKAGLAAAKAMGRVGGRPKALSPDQITVGRALLADPKIPVTKVAETLGIGMATLYRTFPGGRSGLSECTANLSN